MSDYEELMDELAEIVKTCTVDYDPAFHDGLSLEEYCRQQMNLALVKRLTPEQLEQLTRHKE